MTLYQFAAATLYILCIHVFSNASKQCQRSIFVLREKEGDNELLALLVQLSIFLVATHYRTFLIVFTTYTSVDTLVAKS